MLDAVAAADVVLDCSDNFATRHALNRACVALRKPLVSGAALGFSGQLSVFDSRDPDSPCYQCLFPEMEEAGQLCSEAGVLSPLVGVIGALQAVEAIKLLSRVGKPAPGRLLLYDALDGQFREIRVPKDPACTVCGHDAAPG
jgi:adenylyltransferase/sulfurtransferase